MKRLCIGLLMLIAATASYAQPKSGFSFAGKSDQKGIDVLFNGKLLTAYCYYDSIKKPFLWPVNTLDGITVTRGFPIKPIAGERTDHPHHVGVWMNYEAVNGLDFWNNSTAIPFEKRSQYGTIHVSGNNFYIDRTTTLTANDLDVQFKDVKDGFFAIRVARELEQPSTQADVFVDASGNKTEVPKVNNEGVTGNYLTSEGVTGDAAWSTRGPWTALHGKKEGKDITIAIFDHPQNIGYPAYRHARGYGLFAINPLGQKVFSNGKEELNFSLKPGAKVTFRYRMVVASGRQVSANELHQLAAAFK
jgi:hypothetical protein